MSFCWTGGDRPEGGEKQGSNPLNELYEKLMHVPLSTFTFEELTALLKLTHIRRDKSGELTEEEFQMLTARVPKGK